MMQYRVEKASLGQWFTRVQSIVTMVLGAIQMQLASPQNGTPQEPTSPMMMVYGVLKMGP